MAIDLDLDRLASAVRGLDPPVVLTVHPEDSSYGAALADLAASIAAVAEGGVVVEQGAGLPATPALSLGRGDRRAIHYLALPEGMEGPPFVEALLGLAGALPEADGALLEELERPVELMVFVASACPHCANAVRAANRLALASPLVTSIVVDAQRCPDLAGCFSARSVPMTVLDGGLTETGVVPIEDLAGRILARDEAEHGPRVFRSWIEAGRVEDAAAELAAGCGGSHLVAVWRESATALRMGLMLAAELALEDDRSALDNIVPQLLPLLEGPDVSLRGDTADLLGRIGHPSAEGPLRRLLSDTNPDVAEIAAEALEELEEREG